MMLVAWLWLASACGAHLVLSPRVTVLMFLLALLGVALRLGLGQPPGHVGAFGRRHQLAPLRGPHR